MPVYTRARQTPTLNLPLCYKTSAVSGWSVLTVVGLWRAEQDMKSVYLQLLQWLFGVRCRCRCCLPGCCWLSQRRGEKMEGVLFASAYIHGIKVVVGSKIGVLLWVQFYLIGDQRMESFYSHWGAAYTDSNNGSKEPLTVLLLSILIY